MLIDIKYLFFYKYIIPIGKINNLNLTTKSTLIIIKHDSVQDDLVFDLRYFYLLFQVI